LGCFNDQLSDAASVCCVADRSAGLVLLGRDYDFQFFIGLFALFAGAHVSRFAAVRKARELAR
jgi:hypothetical protein